MKLLYKIIFCLTTILLTNTIQLSHASSLKQLAPTPISYEVRLTKYITMHQKYPDSGKMFGLNGDYILRLQINRAGDIVKYFVIYKDGHKLLDKAISDMIKSASPVPAPPPNYFQPNDEVIEFMLPIAFRAEGKSRDLRKIDKIFQLETRKAWQ